MMSVVWCTGIPGWWDMQSEECTRVDDTDVSCILYGHTWLVGHVKRKILTGHMICTRIMENAYDEKHLYLHKNDM